MRAGSPEQRASTRLRAEQEAGKGGAPHTQREGASARHGAAHANASKGHKKPGSCDFLCTSNPPEADPEEVRWEAGCIPLTGLRGRPPPVA